MAATKEKPRLVLWGAGTPRTMRAHWVLHELGLDYESHPIGARTGETQTAEFTKLNLREKIPLLQDGELTLAESAASMVVICTGTSAERSRARRRTVSVNAVGSPAVRTTRLKLAPL